VLFGFHLSVGAATGYCARCASMGAGAPRVAAPAGHAPRPAARLPGSGARGREGGPGAHMQVHPALLRAGNKAEGCTRSRGGEEPRPRRTSRALHRGVVGLRLFTPSETHSALRALSATPARGWCLQKHIYAPMAESSSGGGGGGADKARGAGGDGGSGAGQGAASGPDGVMLTTADTSGNRRCASCCSCFGEVR
jgi:hypothetical protein